MAFEGLTEKLQGALRKLSSKGKLTEDNVKEGMREVRMALLEADVNYAVAKDFIKKVTARCVGTEITGTLSASQQVIKIVNEEMTQLMGGENARLTWSSGPLTVYMLCGLQGAGKTTMAAKLANYLAKQGKSIIMISSEMSEIIGMSNRVMVMCDGRITGFIDGKDATQENIMALATQFETAPTAAANQ